MVRAERERRRRIVVGSEKEVERKEGIEVVASSCVVDTAVVVVFWRSLRVR
jgi:hypothetical protein